MVPSALWSLTDADLPSKKSGSETTNSYFVAARLETHSAPAFLSSQSSAVGSDGSCPLSYSSGLDRLCVVLDVFLGLRDICSVGIIQGW